MILRLFGGLKRQCVVKHYVRHLKVAQNFVLRCANKWSDQAKILDWYTDTEERDSDVRNLIFWRLDVKSAVRSQDSPKVHSNVRMPANDRIKLKSFYCNTFLPEDQNGNVRIMIFWLLRGLKRHCVVKHDGWKYATIIFSVSSHHLLAL